MIRIGTAVSIEVKAVRGIAAGSGMATTEMRIVLINLIDAATIAHPMVVLTVYVDDISAEMTGPDEHIIKELGDCILEIGQALEANHQELSKNKCACMETNELIERSWMVNQQHFKHCTV